MSKLCIVRDRYSPGEFDKVTVCLKLNGTVYSIQNYNQFGANCNVKIVKKKNDKVIYFNRLRDLTCFENFALKLSESSIRNEVDYASIDPYDIRQNFTSQNLSNSSDIGYDIDKGMIVTSHDSFYYRFDVAYELSYHAVSATVNVIKKYVNEFFLLGFGLDAGYPIGIVVKDDILYFQVGGTGTPSAQVSTGIRLEYNVFKNYTLQKDNYSSGIYRYTLYIDGVKVLTTDDRIETSGGAQYLWVGQQVTLQKHSYKGLVGARCSVSDKIGYFYIISEQNGKSLDDLSGDIKKMMLLDPLVGKRTSDFN